MAVSFFVIYFLGKVFKLPSALAILLSVGTTICGGSAIAITAPLIKAREEEVTSAEEDLKLAEERYRVGAGTALELIDAQVTYTSAQSNHVQALYDHKLALAQLEKAMGQEVQ